ncbi:GNAT family N-acetyltransferase [Bacteroidota bacterium]
MTIQGPGFTLRPWKDSDADTLPKHANNKKVADQLRDLFPHPYTRKNAQEWIEMVRSMNDPVKYFAIEVEGEAAGSIAIIPKLDVYRLNAEIGYFLGEQFWGRGIITEALKALVKYGFETFDIIRIYAEPFADNLASRRALEKAGFILEATFHKNVIKNGVIRDSCIYSILKENQQ